MRAKAQNHKFTYTTTTKSKQHGQFIHLPPLPPVLLQPTRSSVLRLAEAKAPDPMGTQMAVLRDAMKGLTTGNLKVEAEPYRCFERPAFDRPTCGRVGGWAVWKAKRHAHRWRFGGGG